MATFALKKIDAVVGQQQFDKLVVDGVCLLDEFEENVEKNYKTELYGIYASMNDVANLKTLPYSKFHYYDKAKGGYREFEFKSKHLRVYGITQNNGKIIILGGTKSTQKKDEAEFRSIKKKYIDSL